MDFYNEKNIFIIGERRLEELREFLSEPFAPVPQDIVKSYSEQEWVSRFVSEDNQRNRI